MPTFPGLDSTNGDCSLENMFPTLGYVLGFCQLSLACAPYPYPPFPVFKRIKAAYQSLVQLEAKLLEYLIPGATPRGIVAKTVAVSWATMVQFEDSCLFVDVLGKLIVE